ncbi:MAG: DUF763 domain-containing protein [Candidatus Pacearchaeota archaeon]
MKTGVANLPLHYGKAPPWLFGRMVKLADAITTIIMDEYGTQEMLRRLSEPWWFQSFGCILGFDWHSSGLTTTVCGALKESFKKNNLLYAVGGKGKASRKTPNEIITIGEQLNLTDNKTNSLIYASRLAAKVDNAAVQDGYRLYHHSFFFDEKGRWAIVQQGMSFTSNYARRYHWLSDELQSFVNEPHTAICCDITGRTLNMVASESKEARKASVDLINDNSLNKFIKTKQVKNQTSLIDYSDSSFTLSTEHFPTITEKMIVSLQKFSPSNYEELLAIEGVGPQTIRSLALISEIVYGTKASWKDPCKFSFAHGGKDGWPYPVNKKIYDRSIKILEDGIKNARLNEKEKYSALRRLKQIIYQ